MEAHIPAIENANVWGLIGLKKGERRGPQKVLTRLHKGTQPLKPTDDLADEKRARRVAYRGVKRQLTLWKGPVYQNRLADQLIFPLNDNAITMANSEQASKLKEAAHIAAEKKRSDTIGGKLYSALYKTAVKPKKDDSQIEISRQVRRKLMEKIAMREKERFILARLAGRNKRQNKIKSKGFHRHQKARLVKEYEKEMEDMRLNNPKKFAQKMLQAELNRAKERAGLRHRGGSKFAKMQKLRAKYDAEAREAVAEMHEKSRELTKKNDMGSGSGSEDSDIDISSSESDEDSDLTDLEEESSMNEGSEDNSSSLLWWKQDPEKDESRKPLIKKVTQPTVLSTLAVEDVLDHCQPTSRASNPQNEEADPELDALDPASDGFFRALQETCAEDVTFKDQFSKEKEEVVDEEAPKDIDTFLPGWNAWTGPGLEAKDEERRKRRIIPAPKVKREDSEKSHVIIKRRVNNDFKQHLVKSIPFPYNTPEQFEAFIAQPISREWVTEEMHKEFTRPKVTVQAGRIIKPIAQSAAILRDKDVERLAKKRKDV